MTDMAARRKKTISDIHPNEKALVGHRLSLHALRRDYGFAKIRDNSPSVESWRVVSNAFEIVFKDCKSLSRHPHMA